MLLDIQARINRQGWRISKRAADEAHPRIDHKKRRIHVDSDLQLAETYFELRGWPSAEDFASKVAHARALENILVDGGSTEKVVYPKPTNKTEKKLLAWVKEMRSDLIDEIGRAHLSETDAALLAARLRVFAQKPHLVREISIKSSVRSA